MLRFKNLNGLEYSERSRVPLGQVAMYRNESKSASELGCNEYISTENLLQEYAGVELTDAQPSTIKVNAFRKGDTLMSNIRPYLKKVWQADFDGGCNADVLVFHSKDITVLDNDYLFHFIARDEFSDYVMSCAKGVKMPRGDKKHIMECEIPLPSIEEQQKIADCLSSVDAVITDYEAQVDNMRNQKKGVMQKLFSQEVRFKADDGSEYPDWENMKLSDICTITSGGTPSTGEPAYWDGDINWYSPNEIGKTKYVSESNRKISELGLKKSSAKMLPKGTILLTTRATLGEMAITTSECCTNQGFHPLIVNDENEID